MCAHRPEASLTHPEVSVIIPTYNRWPMLSRALASALGQRDVELEVIVVDDGSRDATQTQLARVADDRLKVLCHASNLGVAVSRNDGIAEAAAPWVAFLDDDDFWAPTRLRQHLNQAQEQNAAWVFGAFMTFGEDGTVISDNHPPRLEQLARDLYSANRVGTPSTVMARSDLLREAGGFDPRLSVMADWDLWLRLTGMAPAASVTDPLLAYAEHTTNMQLTDWRLVPREFRYMAGKHGAGARAAGVLFAGEAWGRWKAHTDRRLGRRWAASRSLLGVGLRYGSPQDVLRAALIPLGEGAMARASRARRQQLEPPPWLIAGLDAQPSMSAPTESVGG